MNKSSLNPTLQQIATNNFNEPTNYPTMDPTCNIFYRDAFNYSICATNTITNIGWVCGGFSQQAAIAVVYLIKHF